MDEKDLEQLKKIVLGPKKTQTEAGSVEERSVEELEEGLKLIQKTERTSTISYVTATSTSSNSIWYHVYTRT